MQLLAFLVVQGVLYLENTSCNCPPPRLGGSLGSPQSNSVTDRQTYGWTSLLLQYQHLHSLLCYRAGEKNCSFLHKYTMMAWRDIKLYHFYFYDKFGKLDDLG